LVIAQPVIPLAPNTRALVGTLVIVDGYLVGIFTRS
jgi:hypothetical protein